MAKNLHKTKVGFMSSNKIDHKAQVKSHMGVDIKKWLDLPLEKRCQSSISIFSPDYGAVITCSDHNPKLAIHRLQKKITAQ